MVHFQLHQLLIFLHHRIQLIPLKEGYLYVKCTDVETLNGAVSGRILHLSNRDDSPVQAAGIGQQAQFILFQDSKPRYAIIKGFVIDLTKELQELSFPE